VRGGGEGAGRRRKFCAALGLVQNKVVDEKIWGGRVLGCHSDIVSAGQTVRRPSTLKLVKKSRFLAPNRPSTHALTQPNHRRVQVSIGCSYGTLVKPLTCKHMGIAPSIACKQEFLARPPVEDNPCLYTSFWGLGALSVADIPSALAIIRRNAGTCF
jgi:hypothetical protein